MYTSPNYLYALADRASVRELALSSAPSWEAEMKEQEPAGDVVPRLNNY